MPQTQQLHDDPTGITATANSKPAAKQFLFYKAFINGIIVGQPSKIEVEVGDDIDTIKQRLKIENHNTFGSFDRLEMFLYEFERLDDSNDEALHPFDIKWSDQVSWGTKENPLIVKVRRFTTPQQPLQNKIGKYGTCMI